MNCKPGDLAVMIHVNDEEMRHNVGQIVEVLRFAWNDPEFGPRWWVRMTGLGRVSDGRRAWTEVMPEGTFPDCALRPIGGVPVHDEQRDEVPA